MCGLGCGDKSSHKSQNYTPKKVTTGAASSGNRRGFVSGGGGANYGKPKVRLSFSRKSKY